MESSIYKKVFVTGGSGFVGKRLKLHRPEWKYLSSKDVDLTSLKDLDEYFKINKPDAIIHLAAVTGGIGHSVKNQSNFHYGNSIMGLNVLKAAYENDIGRVLSCLSTCCYPDVCESYPMTEDKYTLDKPTQTNYGYGLAKRELYTQSNFYREIFNLNYSTFTPCNIYGPEANFKIGESHFIASLIRKIHECKDGNIELFGTGKPLRQHIYVDDLVKIIPILLDEHNSDVPINIAPNENLSIKQIAKLALNAMNKDIDITFNQHLDGQIRKDVSNSKLIELIGDFKWTSLEDGILNTYKWFIKQEHIND